MWLNMDWATDEIQNKNRHVLKGKKGALNEDEVTERSFGRMETPECYNRLNHVNKTAFEIARAPALFGDAKNGVYSFINVLASNSFQTLYTSPL